MKLSLNKYYIIFSLIGWILLCFLTLALRKIIGVDISENRFKYLIAESITCGVLAYLTTFIVSLYIDFNLNFNNIKRSVIYRIAIIFIMTQILYSFILWPLLDIIDFWGGSGSTAKDATFLIRLFNSIFFATLYFIWLFVFFTVKIYYHLNVVKTKQLQLENSLKESQLNTLKGQINPHFMFNSLNNIRGLILEDVDKARLTLTSLSETLRYSLTKSDSNAIALEDELDMIENYVAISKIQFEDRLLFQMNIDKASLNIEIPPMIIQMLVENAIKHGISNLKKGGNVILNTVIKENQLQIEVSNTGSLNQNKKGTQLGLQNIKRRLELLYGETATFSLKGLENEVVATVKIPIK